MDAKEALEQLAGLIDETYEDNFHNDPVYKTDMEALSVLRAVVDEREALKAEVELQKMLVADLTRDMNEYHDKAEKAEAEIVTLKQEISGNDAAHRLVEAALAEARPLLDAVMGDGTATTSARHPVVIDAWAACVLEFALAYRAGRTK